MLLPIISSASPILSISLNSRTQTVSRFQSHSLIRRQYKFTMGANFLKRMMSCGGAKSFRTKNKVWSDDDEAAEGFIKVHVQGKEDAVCIELPTHFLSHPVFERLLKQSGEEFGYRYDGALRIACDVDAFLRFVHLLNAGDPSAHYFQLPQ